MNFQTLLFSSACAMALCAGQAHAQVDDAPPVKKFNSVKAFQDWAGDATEAQLDDLTSFHLAAYYCRAPVAFNCPADGGEGLFLQQSGPDCESSADDGGSLLRVGKTEGEGEEEVTHYHCFMRQNLNGDIRQFGVTAGSEFDCSPTDGVGLGAEACTAITATSVDHPAEPWSSLVAAATASDVALHKLTFAGLQLKIGETITVPDGTDLDLGGASPFTGNDSLIDIPGTLFLDTPDESDPHISVAMGTHAAIHNGMLLPTWYRGEQDDNIVTLYGYRQKMIDHGNTGLTCISVSGCTIHDMEVDGFDTAIQVRHAPFTVLDNVHADGNVCYWVSAAGGSSRWGITSCTPKITRLDNDVEFLRIDSIAEEVDDVAHKGECRVTLTEGDGADLREDFLIWGRGATWSGPHVTGATNINNRFHVHLPDPGDHDVVDLVGSSCVGETLKEDNAIEMGEESIEAVHATWTAGDRQLHLATIDNIQIGDTIAETTSAGAAIDGKHVAGVWKSRSIVILDEAPITSGADDVILQGGAFNKTEGPCVPGPHQTATGVCLVLDASARIEVGASPGGCKAQGEAVAYLIGGPRGKDDPSEALCESDDTEDDDLIAGFRAIMPGVFNHVTAYHIQNANQTHLISATEDAVGTYEDPGRTFVKVDGDSNNVSIVSSTGQKSGTGIYVKVADAAECVNYVAGANEAESDGDTQFDIEDGCFIAQGMRPGNGNAFIAGDADNVSLSGSYLNKTNVFYENATARAHTSTLGAVVESGQNNLVDGPTYVTSGNLGVGVDPTSDVAAPLEVFNAATKTADPSDIHGLSSSGLGAVTVTSTDGFPASGLLLVDGELMSYTKLDGTRFNITARGLWGTANKVHANAAPLSFLNVLVGDNPAELPQFAVTSRGGVWHLTTSGKQPAFTNIGGLNGTIVGNDNAGRITTPASGPIVGTSEDITFATPWDGAPVCFAQNETSGEPWPVTSVSATKVTFSGPLPGNSNAISYTCTGFKL